MRARKKGRSPPVWRVILAIERPSGGLVERMEKEGVVGPASGKAGGRREVFVQAM